MGSTSNINTNGDAIAPEKIRLVQGLLETARTTNGNMPKEVRGAVEVLLAWLVESEIKPDLSDGSVALSEFENIVIQNFLQNKVISAAIALGEAIDIEKLKAKISTYWNEIIIAYRSNNWMQMFVIIDRLSNGFPDLKIELVKAIMPNEDILTITITESLYYLSKLPLIISESELSKEGENGIKLKKDLATEFYTYKSTGIGIIQNASNVNDPSGEKPAYIIHISGRAVKEIARLLALYKGDESAVLYVIENTFKDNHTLIQVYKAVLKYIYLLGNNYVDHDYTNSSSSVVGQLEIGKQRLLKVIEGVILSNEFFDDDIISIPTEDILTRDSRDFTIAGGIRYTFAHQGTLSQQSVPARSLKETLEIPTSNPEAFDVLMKFINSLFQDLTESDLVNLADYWGLDFKDFLINTEGIKGPRDIKAYNKSREFIKQTWFDGDTMMKTITPLLDYKIENGRSSSIVDPRFNLLLGFLDDLQLEGEFGRLVKLEPKEARKEIFPGLEGINMGIEYEIVSFIKEVNTLANKDTGVPMTTAFIQPSPGLLIKTNFGSLAVAPDSSNYILVNAMVRPKLKEEEVSAAMGGYFSLPTGKVMCINIDWLIMKSRGILQEDLMSKTILTYLISASDRTTQEEKEKDALRKFWTMEKKDILSILQKRPLEA